MCFLGILYEIASNIIGGFSPYLKHKYNIHNMYLTDAILKFVFIPFLYLLNDEQTKEIIYEENWYQGIRFVAGVYTKPLNKINSNDNSNYVARRRPENIVTNRNRDLHAAQTADSPTMVVGREFKTFQSQLARTFSIPIIINRSATTCNRPLKRCYSLENNIVKTSVQSQNNLRPYSKSFQDSKLLSGSCSSVETLHIT